MKAKKRGRIGLLVNNKGFTLIEIAIVLIIIGIIIGAVVKGKDLIRGAEQKRLYSKFVSSWQIAYNTYYDRTGWILGDDVDASNTARNGHCGNPDGTPAGCGNLLAQLRAVGLEPPAQGPTGSACIRTYTDSQGNSYDLNIVFDHRAATGNYIRISGANGIPTELGMAWDRIIDDIRDGTAGDLLYTANHVGALTFALWPDATAVPVAASAAILRLSF